MSVFENITGAVVLVIMLIVAYFLISFNQAQNFEQQSDNAQVTFFEHKISQDASAILSTREPFSGMTLNELIAYSAYYKKPAIEIGKFTQLNIAPTVKNVFDAVYGNENYYFEVDPKRIDVFMVFVVDGSRSLFEDLEKLKDTLPPLIESFEGTGITVEPIVYIMVSSNPNDLKSFDCSSFDWLVTIKGRTKTISCQNLSMEDVYSKVQFRKIGQGPVYSYEDWASAIGDRALFFNETGISSVTLFFPITDELSTGSEPDKCKKPDYSYCEKLYSYECCSQPLYDGLYVACGNGRSGIKSSCLPYFDEPDLCGNAAIASPSVYDCWLCEELGKRSTFYDFCLQCQNYRAYCEVCGEAKPEGTFECGSQRSADTIGNTIKIFEEIDRPDFYVFPIKTSPCYPPRKNSTDPLSCDPKGKDWGYQCWNFPQCSASGSSIQSCCDQPVGVCPACRVDGQEACVRKYCDQTFEINGTPFPAEEFEDKLQDDDLTQQMALLAKVTANKQGRILDLTTISDLDEFKQELRELVIDIVRVDFRLGTLKQQDERFISETTIPLSNGNLTSARLWVYKDRNPHIIQKAESDISRINFPPEAKILVFPQPYCGQSPECSVTFDGRDSNDPNMEDPVFGENLYFEWKITPTDDPDTDFAVITENVSMQNFTISLPHLDSEKKRYYNIQLTVMDEQGLSDVARVENYCVGEACKPKLLYIFMPVKWNSTYSEYKDSAEKECSQIKASMPCDADQIECRYVEADSSGNGLSFNCSNVAPASNDGCVSANDSGSVLSAIHDCAIDSGLDDPALNWNKEKRVLGLMPAGMPFCNVGGVVGYTQIYFDTAVDRTGWPYIGIHELGHTYGLCDEYSQLTWAGQDSRVTCVNAWPGNTSGCGSLLCGDSCKVESPWTCLSAMGPALQLPKTITPPSGSIIPTGSVIRYRDYDEKTQNTSSSALGDSDKKHIKVYTEC